MNKLSAIVTAPENDDQYLSDDWEIIEGDAFEMLDHVPDGSCKLVVTSPPYNIGKEYERDERLSLPEYVRWLNKIIGKLCDKITPDGHICWQSGNFVESGEVFPLDTFFYRMFKRRGFKLRNRIIWHFNFGLHAQSRFSGRYETLLWFTKSDNYTFNLDPVREPQLYPGIAFQIEQFVTINSEARGVPTSLVYDLISYLPSKINPNDIARERAIEIAKEIRKTPGAALQNRIVTTSSPKNGQVSLTNFVRKVQPLVHPEREDFEHTVSWSKKRLFRIISTHKRKYSKINGLGLTTFS